MEATTERHHIVGGGIAGLATAVFLLRDAGVDGAAINVYEQLGTAGGSLDGSGDGEDGYLVRGGRMFEEHFACTFDLLGSIPSADDPATSAAQDIFAFNRMVPGSANCRIVRDGKPAEDRFDLTLTAQDIVDINRLILHREGSLGAQTIEDWFQPTFLDSNFWLMWSTMFSFQPWHSVVEMRRYLRRFIHLFPGFTRIAGILRTRYNQYDSLIAPIVSWLRDRGVQIVTGTQVVDVRIEGTRQDRRVSALAFASGEEIPVAETDKVYLTLGSMTDASVTGSNDRAPSRDDHEGGAWTLWRKLAAEHEGFGRPEVFCSETDKTAWHSFTVTLDSPDFFEFMEDFTGNRTGTGGLVTFADSGWTLSIVLFHQPNFRGQKHGTYVFWGYGLRGDRPGDFTAKPMWEATGDEILTELFGHMGLTPEQQGWFKTARVIPCRMPFITSQFMPRQPGDRPDTRPSGASNFAIIGQFCELPRDCVFTVEYSVRSARAAVASLTGRITPPPPVARTDLDPKVLFNAARVLMGM
ncbi:oleate hydratase [Thioclava sp. DLFJ5-1]|uniref:oleate hydratase n=1 Tax=Thioclava sp. DLFJ5-1 TaxID=1915314 RepID=UPI000998C38F|nr:oleate hydratase [Thioclava sp. DLFJ5-1]OOY21091.1 oleate hydratase [Thioclava sp. DLFJ5-1]